MPVASARIPCSRDEIEVGGTQVGHNLQLAAGELGVGPEMMRHVAPFGWEHLSLAGDYAWDAEGQLTPGELRALRTKASLLAA